MVLQLSNLRSKLEEAQKGYVRMFSELQSLELGKPDNAVSNDFLSDRFLPLSLIY